MTLMEESLTCLSMHQPWASLLVYGIKRIEGRTWDSHQRGRLWIHATSKAVEPDEVAQLQAFYTQIHRLNGHVPQFPPAYPTGVLLGSVEVVDVLPSAAVEQWPGLPESCRLEASSPFCFLCQDPKRLVVPQPLRGQQRLWLLPKAVLKVAKQGLRDPPGLLPFSWRAFGDPRVMLSPPPAPGAASPAPKGAQCPQQQHKDSKARGPEEEPDGEPEEASARAGIAEGCGRRAAQDGDDGDGVGVEGVVIDGAELDRRLRAVRKKLRQVSELEAAQRSESGALTPEQQAKLARAAEWRRELHLLDQAAARATTAGQEAAKPESSSRG